MIELRTLQMALLDIALEIKRICEKNKIPYILCGGSLLGAVRHKGFIPWDDDMDIAMLREDYEKFLCVCQQELDSNYILQTYKTDPQYANSFAKIGIKDTTLVNPDIHNEDTWQGINVDVFPVDVFPNSIIKRQLQNFQEKNLCNAAYIKAQYHVDPPISIPGKIRRLFVCKYEKKHTLQDILEEQIKYEQKYNYTKSTEVGIVFFQESYITKLEFTNSIESDFEGYTFTIPRNYDQILKGIYGNYTELPPENKRIAHNYLYMDIGNYQIRCMCNNYVEE